jgi:hypothetical protein
MSKHHERKEKICLNCNTEIHGRYCHNCGQENIEPKESFWHLVQHFFEDITHFDGKFFTTIKTLLFKPGVLSKEYIAGKRARSLHPIRMYVFTSCIMFFIIWGFYSSKETNTPKKQEQQMALTPLQKFQNEENSVKTLLIIPGISSREKIKLENKLTQIQSRIDSLQKNPNANFDSDNYVDFSDVSFFNTDVTIPQQYDSIQQSLPKNKRDNIFMRLARRKGIQLSEKYRADKTGFQEHITEQFFHHIPQMLFVSLPIFALFLQLLYIRERKKYFYVNHIIYTLHLYCAFFILILLSLFTGSLFGLFNIHKTGWLIFIFSLGALFYWYKSMRNFYEQSRVKTVFKLFLLSIMSFIIGSVLLVLLLMFSIISI